MSNSILDQINDPHDLRKLAINDLPQVAAAIRERIIDVVGRSGGHLASNLGVTELTIALHYVFDFASDRLLWDVGHQCYPHKLLTGRHARFDSLRKSGGISGFPSIHESEYDLFNVGHAGTAIATAVGMARGDQMRGNDRRVVALVGDASIVNGLAFEGLNQAGLLKRQLLVILNDNQWGIGPTQGGVAEHLAKFRTSELYEEVKERTKRILPRIPVVGSPMFNILAHLKEGIKATVSPHQIFEHMGFHYVGPTDGHDIEHLVDLLTALRDAHHPVLLHVHTQKGRGAEWACAEPGRFHSPKPFTISAGKADIKRGSGKSWTAAFADVLSDRAERDDRIFALTAGMADGTGLAKFAEVHPERCCDVGIAESCNVDMAAGMAKTGMRPVCAIYSTFLQRALDQVFQEVVLQQLPVIVCIDRAGVVGGDGAVHHGFMDIAYLRPLPNIVLMAPADELELGQALDLALALDRPAAIRYPRDNVPEEPLGPEREFVLGQSVTLRDGTDVTLLAYGSTVSAALEAAELLAIQNVAARVVNARFVKPIDQDMVRDALTSGHPVLTIEDHGIEGGFGSAVLESAQQQGLPADMVQRLGMPADRFIMQGARAAQLAEVGIDAAGIAGAAVQALGGASDVVPDATAQMIEPSPR